MMQMILVKVLVNQNNNKIKKCNLNNRFYQSAKILANKKKNNKKFL